MASIFKDFQVTFRQLQRSPAFALPCVVTLALGIGANTAIYSVINAVLLRPLAYARPAELVTWRGNESLLDVEDIRAQSGSFFAAGGAVNPEPMDFTSGPEPLTVHAGFVDAGLFQVLGVPAKIGRTLLTSDDHAGGSRVVVLAYPFWKEHLGGDPNIVGKAITLSANAYTVIGVMPESFRAPEFNLDVFVSLWVAYPEAAAYRGVHFMRSYWRLKPGIGLEQAAAGMNAIDANLMRNYPNEEKNRRTVPVGLQQSVTGKISPALRLLFGAVSVVLLIACANFASLLMVRSANCRRQMVIRAALGGDRRSLIHLVLSESIVLAIAGGIVGLVLSLVATRILVATKPAALSQLTDVSIDSKVLVFCLGVSVLTGLVFGLVPAWTSSSVDISEALKHEGRSATIGPSGLSFRSVLVAWQTALALMLLTGAGLLINSFARVRSIDPGFNPERIISIPIQLPASRYEATSQQTLFRRELLIGLNSLPGVDAAMVSDIPLNGSEVTHSLVIEGKSSQSPAAGPEVDTLCVMGNYFGLMEIPVRAGRALTDMDREDHPLVAVVNQTFASQHLAGQNPIGRRIRWARDPDTSRWMTIVGVVGDVKQSSLDLPSYPAVYTPFSQSNEAWRRWMSVVVRTPNNPGNFLPAIKETIWNLDNRIPIDDIMSMKSLLSLSLSERRFNMSLLLPFACVAALLSSIGIYSVVAYTVNKRTHEIGIRMALGATRNHVLGLILVYGGRIAFFGLAGGIFGVFVFSRLMKSLLFNVTPTDPIAIGGALFAMMIVVLIACYIPARRAITVDPVISLRGE